MSGADKITAGLTEAVAIVSGEQPAPRIHMYGHAYVPEAALRASEERAAKAEAEVERIRAMLPDWAVLDPPDGGDVRTWEGVERVVAALRASEERAAKAERVLAMLALCGEREVFDLPDDNPAAKLRAVIDGLINQRARVKELEAALRPFAIGALLMEKDIDERTVTLGRWADDHFYGDIRLCVGDLRRARAALGASHDD